MSFNKLQVLLVEDETANIDAWNDQARTHNADVAVKGYLIETQFARSSQEAMDVLNSNKIDVVIVDLRLQRPTGLPCAPNDDGNALMKHVAGMHPVAMAVYSGQRAEADVSDFPQVEVFDRGDGLDPVFSWLGKQLEMMMRLRDTRQSIERETALIFFRSIWPRWERWTKDAPEERLRGDPMTRHVVAHVHDSMLYSNGGKTHPEETYFIPPLKEQLDTGDLIRDDEFMWVVVSPRCDMAIKKMATVLLARCQDIKGDWERNKKNRSKMAQHDNAPKWHFLPEIRDVAGETNGPWYVEFGHLKAVAIADAEEELTKKRFASLAPQFVPSLVERFGAYFSRIGTPNLTID